MKNKKIKIMPCLDFKDGRVVKGVNFVDIKAVGDAVENAKFYELEGADELAFLDISATVEGRRTTLEVIKNIVKAISIPLSVGGGIASVDDAKRLIDIGVSCISINSAAIKNPKVIEECAKKLGSKKTIVAIDGKKVGDNYNVFTHAGTTDSGIKCVEWAKKVKELGAGALLVTSIDRDGAKNGYDLDLTGQIIKAANLPTIASGGAGKLEDFLAAARIGCTTVLAASLFHFREIEIKVLKKYLSENGF